MKLKLEKVKLLLRFLNDSRQQLETALEVKKPSPLRNAFIINPKLSVMKSFPGFNRHVRAGYCFTNCYRMRAIWDAMLLIIRAVLGRSTTPEKAAITDAENLLRPK